MYQINFLLFALPFFLLPAPCQAQDPPTQTIRGIILDKDTRQPLIGATISVSDLGGLLGAVTELDGSFLIEKVPVGRHSLEAGYIGYAPWRADGLVLTTSERYCCQTVLCVYSIPEKTDGRSISS